MKTLHMAACLIASVVLISGTASPQVRPALTQDIDQPGRNTFTLRVDSTTSGVGSFTVPAGKRYVVDQYTGDCAVVNTASVLDVELVTSSNSVIGVYHAPVHYSENIGFGLVSYAGTGSGPIYADPGTTITVVVKNSTGLDSTFRGCSFVVTGHVINNP
jgi:hypothetical protein